VVEGERVDGSTRPALVRWGPFAFTLFFAAAILLRAGTAPVDVLRYAAYVSLAVVLPGTLVYRALRRRPHTLVEDLAMGAAVGLTLELIAWAAFSVLDLRGLVWLWPALVFTPFALIPRLRRHWWVRDYRPVPLGWSWSVAAVVSFFTAYLAMVFLDRNPILPTSPGTQQYLDLAYQLSLAGEAKHHIPLNLPQVAGEPLYYHWFGYVHMAMTSMVGSIDLPVVALRFAIPALCALAIVLTATVAWRVSGRPYVGAAAAALFFTIGEFNFTHPVTMPFGTQATFVIWHGMSMIYGWVLVIAVIAPLADIIGRRARADVGGSRDIVGMVGARDTAGVVGSRESTVPPLGRGAFALAALLLFASSGAKASSLPVVAVALAATAVIMLLMNRRIPWAVVVAGLLAGAAQLFATTVLFRFNTYGVAIGPLQGLRPYWATPPPGVAQGALIAAVWIAFVVNMLLRTAGILPLLWLKRGRLEPVQWFLLAGALAGPGLYLIFEQPSGGNQYFTRTGFAFGVMLSAWGYAMVFDRARLTDRAKLGLAGGAVAFAIVLVWAELEYAGPARYDVSYSSLVPILVWAAVLTSVGLIAGVAWWIAGRWRSVLRGRGAVVALTGVLVAGAPGLIMDEYKSLQAPNGGAYVNISLPKSRVDAARWVRDHSAPNDVVATNVHCLGYYGDVCDSRSFWLSAYSERSVLVEGWGFAPRQAVLGLAPFWDQTRLTYNDAAFTAPSAEVLRRLHDTYGVRWLVVDRNVGAESADLPTLAEQTYDNGRLAVYRLR
jgi:hypothetical protein